MARKSKAKYQVGEIVVIENPEVFVRCGYPMGQEEARQGVMKLVGDDIRKVLQTLGGEFYDYPEADYYSMDLGFKKAVSAFAYTYLKAKGFGGNERRIHTKRDESLKGRRAEVLGWSFKMTGDYYPPHHSRDYEGEHDYEPGGLESQKSHRVLELRIMNTFESIQIEECHIRKLTEEEANQLVGWIAA